MQQSRATKVRQIKTFMMLFLLAQKKAKKQLSFISRTKSTKDEGWGSLFYHNLRILHKYESDTTRNVYCKVSIDTYGNYLKRTFLFETQAEVLG